MSASGTLYLVATPIGNLEDITLRAVRILKEVNLIACEDTRHTRVLLAHLDIRTPTISLHEHNERTRTPHILKLLREGKSVALVSDAGTPAISDPGAALVAAVSREGCRVVSIPGASAVTAAVPLADFFAERFAFVGFLPRKQSERRRMLESLRGLTIALVIFETPHRVRKALEDIDEVLGGRRMVLVRELTKVHEEVLRGTAAQIRESLGETPRGEVTLVIEGAPETAASRRQTAHDASGIQGVGQSADRESPDVFLRSLLAQGLSRRDAARALAVAYRMPSKEAYRIAIGER